VREDGMRGRIDVPVEMPEGVSLEGVFGDEKEQLFGQRSHNSPFDKLDSQASLSKAPKVAYRAITRGDGSASAGAGSGNRTGGRGNVGGGAPLPPSAPPLPPASSPIPASG